jgi:hypothetical protein
MHLYATAQTSYIVAILLLFTTVIHHFELSFLTYISCTMNELLDNSLFDLLSTFVFGAASAITEPVIYATRITLMLICAAPILQYYHPFGELFIGVTLRTSSTSTWSLFSRKSRYAGTALVHR